MAKKEIKKQQETAGVHECAEHGHAHEQEHQHSAEQEQQEKMIRMSMLEQDAKQIEQQLMMIEQQIVELQNLKVSLDEIEKAKENDEILASIGKNIFIKTALLSKELLIHVGAKTAVKKSIAETQKIVDKEISQISEVREQMAKAFERIVAEMQGFA